MARPRAFEEKVVLDRAADVFGRHGYDGTTMVELTSAMGLNSPSIYAAFGSKRGLFDAVLKRCSAREDEHWAWALAAPTAEDVVKRLLTTSPEQTASRILVHAALAMSSENTDIPQALLHRRQAAELRLRDRFEEAKRANDLPADADTSRLASYVTSVLGGLAMKAAGAAPHGELRQAAEQALAAWRAFSDVANATVIATRGSRPAPEHSRDSRRFNADAALDAAMKVFWTKGFGGASLNDLTEAMGITRPSLYAAFGNKEALFFRALDLYQSLRKDYMTEALQAETARGVFEALLRGALCDQLDEKQPRGCLMVLNAIQGGDEAEPIRHEVRRRQAMGREVLAARFERAKKEGDLSPNVNVEGLVRFVQSLLHGILSQGGAGASPGELEALVESSIAMWTASVNLSTGKDRT
ncbi:TetR/AcrR family transcriptional regulator [Rhizobium ruizarguesonis]|uniref:TetR/AcrR family transcriptional regulator n=1 Tax=Rhizobium ruizarguesonis TaxID=2081791 RepID=UPI001031CB23|nr:TetR/AcrR family transcriptional regulator [Rhizobium ruizarguesonis]TAX62939.1 TetR/AcrR family transcriptional regulator [Rhizobium ruizarguesonis]